MDVDRWLTLEDAERAAQDAVDPASWAYVAGGAGRGDAVAANVAAYDSLWLVPRIPEELARRVDTTVSIAGTLMEMPILLAPTSPQRLLHPEAELATARAARSAGVISIVSADSHYAFPEIAAAAPGHCWFQLYAYRSREHVAAAIDLALSGGASTLVVTVDATYAARRIAAKRAGFRTPTFVDFGTLRMLGVLDGEVPADARLERLPITWSDLEWIRRRTDIPLFVKGVLHPDDAQRCVDMGAEGIIVSNHGGRQLDGAIPTVCALESVAAQVSARCAVLVDGGIRSGLDVVKALALGAHAVCVGRPYLWGLSAAGEQGVAMVLRLLKAELEDALRQLGLPSVAALDHRAIAGAERSPSGAAPVSALTRSPLATADILGGHRG